MSNFKSRTNQIVKSDRVVINKQNVMEVGGNTAIESIEQLGYKEKFEVEGESTLAGVFSVPTSAVVLTGVSSLSDSWQEGGPEFEELTEGVVAYSNEFGGPFAKVNGVIYNGHQGSKAYGENLAKGTNKEVNEIAIIDFTPAHEESVYKPFFTEEQYQALLDLIENE